MVKEEQGLTVQAVSFVDEGGPVFYASLPSKPYAAETLKGCGTNGAEAKDRLISTLWNHFLAIESPFWKGFHSSNRAAFPIQVVRGLLGQPHLLLGEYRGPAISFSEGGGKVWAALCGDESDIGLDVAGADEFPSKYPFDRVFHPQELQQALRMADGDLEKASALLWSIKEAVVKSLGCGFNLMDPREIIVYPSTGESIGRDGGYAFPVGLSGKALMWFPISDDRSLWVRSFPQGKMWLSIALLPGQH